jgi:RHS repeat-associated protein
VNSTVTDYFYLGGVVLSEKQGANWTDYIFFGGLRIGKQTGSSLSTATFFHPDHLGSTRVCTDASGNALGSCDYEPFGAVQPGSSCSLPTNYRFAGMVWDAETGLYHTWFRRYDPSQGRWMSVDPLAGNADTPNRSTATLMC